MVPGGNGDIWLVTIGGVWLVNTDDVWLVKTLDAWQEMLAADSWTTDGGVPSFIFLAGGWLVSFIKVGIGVGMVAIVVGKVGTGVGKVGIGVINVGVVGTDVAVVAGADAGAGVDVAVGATGAGPGWPLGGWEFILHKGIL